MCSIGLLSFSPKPKSKRFSAVLRSKVELGRHTADVVVSNWKMDN